MRLVLPAIYFLIEYMLMMLACGAVVLAAVRACRRGTGSELTDETRQAREDLGALLIGSGFAPFVIGVLQGGLYWAVPGLPLLVYPAIEWALAIAALLALRRTLGSALVALTFILRDGLSAKIGTVAVVGMLVLVGGMAARHALAPQRHYDATTYALDARRLAEQRSWDALMDLEPRGEDNQFANHNHGGSYQAYLSAGLSYKRNALQDLGLRAAQEVLAAHVFIVLVGLSLRISGLAAVIAPAALMSYAAYGHMIASSSRDFYRLLPFLLVIGLATDRRAPPGFNWILILLTAAWAYLWNAHAMAILIAPLLLACLLLTAGSWRSAAAMVAAFVLAIPLGAWRLVDSAMRTGSPLGDSPLHNANYDGTAIVEPWYRAREVIPDGLTHAWGRLARLWHMDGAMLVSLTTLAALGVGVWIMVQLARRRRDLLPPALVIACTLFILASLALVTGLADWLQQGVSGKLAMNYRYRAQLYPAAAIVIAWIIDRFAAALQARAAPDAPIRPLAAALVVIVFAFDALSHPWSRPGIKPCVNSLEGYDHLAATQQYYRWVGLLRHVPVNDLVLMDYAYLGWYQTPNRIMFTQDPRLRPLFVSDNADEVVRLMDDLEVRYVFLIELERRAILESGAALGRALRSDAFELVESMPQAWHLYRRVNPTSGSATALLATAAREDDPRMASGPARGAAMMQALHKALETLASESLAEREAAAERLLRLGRRARGPLIEFALQSSDENARIAALALISAIESPNLVGLDVLDAIRESTILARRVDAPDHDPIRATTLEAYLRDEALLRGVSRVLPADVFVRELLARSAIGSQFEIKSEDGSVQSLESWLKSLAPADEP